MKIIKQIQQIHWFLSSRFNFIKGLILLSFMICPIVMMGQGTISRNKTQNPTNTTSPKKTQQHKQGANVSSVRKPQKAQPQHGLQPSVGTSNKQKINRGNNTTFTVNGVSFTMVYISSGTFSMGATQEMGGDVLILEEPVHSVTLSSYYIGQTEVTQALWMAVMGDNPSKFFGYDNMPVENVSWEDCQDFIKRLNQLTGHQFRLPTEAEWEYAARGGNVSRKYKFSGSNYIGDVAWYDSNSSSKPHEVRTKLPNELGLYDMTGNVLEWCHDWYGSYDSNSQVDPKGPSSGSARVIRGGSYATNTTLSHISCRLLFDSSLRNHNFGFRLAL